MLHTHIPSSLKKARIAIVHDWLVEYSGAERVLEQIVEVFPHADLFAVIDYLRDGKRSFIKQKRAATTFIQKLPFARTRYRSYLPLMPLAIEQLDLSPYHLIVSSSHAVAKGILSGPDQLHVSYVHSPIRYAWDLQHEYLREANLDRGLKGWAAKWFLHRLRIWDTRTSHGVNHFIANSKFIARRIKKVYGRDAAVVYPPVDIGQFGLQETKGDYYLTASRLVPYKRVDLIVDAFARMPDRRLIVAGDGPEMPKIRSKLAPNISLLGYCEQNQLVNLMQNAKAFIIAAREDFGIAPVEAQACGTPVIAFGAGGVLESVSALGSLAPTGLFFPEQHPESLMEATDAFEHQRHVFSPTNCRAQATKFSADVFRTGLRNEIERAWSVHGESQAAVPFHFRHEPGPRTARRRVA